MRDFISGWYDDYPLTTRWLTVAVALGLFAGAALGLASRVGVI
jgi:hypothetical protein